MNRKAYLLLKEKTEKLNFLMTLSYPTLYRQKGSEHELFISLLNLKSQNSDILKAKEELHQKKKEYFEDMIEHGIDKEIPFPEGLDFRFERQKILKNAIRPLFLFLFVVILAFASGKVFTKTLVSGFEKAQKKIENAGVSDAVKKQERFERFQRLMEEAKPYIQEVKKAWQD